MFTSYDIYSKIPDKTDYAIIIFVNMPVFNDPSLVSFNNNHFERGYTSVGFYEKKNNIIDCIRFKSRKSSILASIFESKNRTAIIANADKDVHNVACIFSVKHDDYIRAKKFIKTCDKHYDTAKANCTSFAINVLNHADIKINIKHQQWVVTEKTAYDFKKWAHIPFFNEKQIQRFFNRLIQNKKGYTPASLGLFLINELPSDINHVLIST